MLRQPIVWCCPFCQRMFDVGCCPEHRALERYTASDKEMARQPTPAPRPAHKETPLRGRESE